MPARTRQLMEQTRAYLSAIESGQVDIDSLQSSQLQAVKEGLHQALMRLSEVAPLGCNGNPCPNGMSCVNNRCIPPPL